jgi:diguanylate cyclase (GGDEF)-like protein
MDIENIIALEKMLSASEDSDSYYEELLSLIQKITKAENCIWMRNDNFISVGIPKEENQNIITINISDYFGKILITNPNIIDNSILEFIKTFLLNIETFIKIKYEYEEQLYIDSLTNVYNNTALINKINSQVTFNNIGVMFADINGLGVINNIYGHEYGDYMIKTVAKCISDNFRKQDIYRKGGDEFVIIVTDIDKRLFIEKTILVKQELNTTEFTASFGYAYSKHTNNIKELINKADQNMYYAKEKFRESNPSIYNQNKYAVKRLKINK